MTTPTPPAVSEAMREAVAQDIGAALVIAGPGVAIGTGVFEKAADHVLRTAGPIASDFARLTGERDAALEKERLWIEVSMLQAEHRVAAEAETARLRAALEAAADAVGRASVELRREYNHAAAEVAFTAAKTARAALTSQEQADV